MNYRLISAVILSFVMVTSVFAFGAGAHPGADTDLSTDEKVGQTGTDVSITEKTDQTETDVSINAEIGQPQETEVQEEEKNNSTESNLLASSDRQLIVDEIYDSGAQDDFKSMIKTSDGGFLLAGQRYVSGYQPSNYEGWLLKVDSEGNIEWERSFNRTFGRDGINSLTETNDGYVFSGQTGNGETWIAEVNSSGYLQWETTKYDGWSNSIITTSDGGLLSVGGEYDGSTFNYQVVKTNSTGSVEFRKIYGNSDYQSGDTVTEMSDGYALAGNNEVLKIDDSGTKQWKKQYADGVNDEFHSIKSTSDGGLIVAGEYYWEDPYVNVGGWLVKLDSSGNKEWEKVHDVTGNRDKVFSVEQINDGGYVFSGVRYSTQAWLVRTDSSGNIKWREIYGNSNAYSVEVSEGNYTMAGLTDYGDNDPNFFLAKYEGFPNTDLSKSSMSYGELGVGKKSTDTVTVENVGDAKLEVTDISITGDEAFSIIGDHAPFVLDLGEKKTFEVEFAPEKEGKKTATLEIESNDPDNPTREVVLEGEGLPPDISSTQTRLQYVGNTTNSFYVENGGDGYLEITGVNVTGRDASNFEVKSPDSFTVAPGEREAVEVGFSASTEGEKQATLEIESDDPDTPVTRIDLVGVITQTDLEISPT